MHGQSQFLVGQPFEYDYYYCAELNMQQFLHVHVVQHAGRGVSSVLYISQESHREVSWNQDCTKSPLHHACLQFRGVC